MDAGFGYYPSTYLHAGRCNQVLIKPNILPFVGFGIGVMDGTHWLIVTNNKTPAITNITVDAWAIEQDEKNVEQRKRQKIAQMLQHQQQQQQQQLSATKCLE
uniref:Uncharacterized protein n=1 Tax=Globodera rostochiensis TaxID=31243 RepID=A0A914HP44_GLORO